MIKFLDKDTGAEEYNFPTWSKAAQFFGCSYQSLYTCHTRGWKYKKRYVIEYIKAEVKDPREKHRKYIERITKPFEERVRHELYKFKGIDLVLQIRESDNTLIRTMSKEFYLTYKNKYKNNDTSK